MPSRYIKRILEASVYDVAVETPIHPMPLLSENVGNRVLLKREDLQPVFSFKLRGAYNKLSKLSTRQKKRGVIAASAGNHAQGIAISAQKLKIKSTIVMPKTTPQIKVAAVRQRGSKVILHGDRFDDSCLHAKKIAAAKGYVFIHPYDDADVIAGQGTIGMEILRQHTDPIYAVFIPVGGGGLIAGIAAYIKYLRPEIKVIGVEAEDSACLKAALDAGRRVKLPSIGIFADGVAVSQIGKEPFRVAKDCVDEVVTATSDEICAAIAGHPDVAECAVIGVKDSLKGELPLAFLVLNAGVDANPEAPVADVVARVREQIGPVAAFEQACVVPRLPKTRSGKILRSTMRKIADSEAYRTPPTIEDPSSLDEIRAALEALGYAKQT